MLRILIFGATGFIGGHLVASAAASGHEVVALSRRGARPLGATLGVRWSLDHPLPDSTYRGSTYAVHLAHDFAGEQGAQRTIRATLSTIAQLRRCGVSRQLFFSSYSAGEHAASLYGRAKLTIERHVSSQHDVLIVRPGLVLGEGGIYGRIRKYARILPIIPLPDGGRGEVPVIEIDQLCERSIGLLVNAGVPQEANLFDPHMKSLRELVLESAAEVGRRPIVLSVPSQALIRMLRLAEMLHLPLPVKADNLAGFIANQAAQHAPTINR